MRSAALKSAIVFTAGFRVVNTYGIDCTAQIARTSSGVPKVLSHSVASEGEATDQLNRSAQQSVVQRARTAHGLPADTQAVDAEPQGVRLDQLSIFHHHLRQERQTILLAEIDGGKRAVAGPEVRQDR
jgi:hypothetical protein